MSILSFICLQLPCLYSVYSVFVDRGHLLLLTKGTCYLTVQKFAYDDKIAVQPVSKLVVSW